MDSIHGPLGYEPNTLTTAPLQLCLRGGRESKKNRVVAKKHTAWCASRHAHNCLLRRKETSLLSPFSRVPKFSISHCQSTDTHNYERAPRPKVARPNYSPGGCSGKLLYGRLLGRSSLRKVRNCSREAGSGELLSGRWFPGNTLGRWFGRITLRKAVPGNYSRGGGSAELLSGR